MPTVGPFHGFYWNFSDTNVAPVAPTGRGGYPGWQASVTATAVVFWPPLSAIQPWIDRLRWAWQTWRFVWRHAQDERVWLDTWLTRLAACDPEQRAVLERVILAMSDARWPVARQAVRTTATTLGFADPQAWIPYGRELKSDPGRAENVYRHQKAMRHLRDAYSSTLTNPQQNLVIELAYQGLSAMGR